MGFDRGKYLVELSQHLPIRNINLYLDSSQRMSDVTRREIDTFEDSGLEKVRTAVFERKLETKPKEAIEMLLAMDESPDNVKAVGKLLLAHMRQGRINKEGLSCLNLPFGFLSYGIREDLILRGQGPCFIFVERVLDELVREEILTLISFDPEMMTQQPKYTHEDMGVIFLGYSFLNQGNLNSIVTFPPEMFGFVARLHYEVKKLFPRLQ